MTIQIETERLPAYWASALVNDDWSGYTEEDCEQIQHYAANELAGLECVNVEDDESFQLAPSYAPWLLAGTYATFVFYTV